VEMSQVGHTHDARDCRLGWGCEAGMETRGQRTESGEGRGARSSSGRQRTV